MIRLVTQFDSAEAKVSAATPTCAGCSCSCCCCCVATAISTSAYTAMNLRMHARELKEETGKSLSPWPEILGGGVLAFSIFLAVILLKAGLGAGGVVIAVAVWGLSLVGLYAWVRTENPVGRGLLTILSTGFFAVLELFLGAGLVGNGDGAAYLIVAGLAAIAAIVVMYNHLLVRS